MRLPTTLIMLLVPLSAAYQQDIQLALTRTRAPLRFQVTLKNVSNTARVLNVGVILANGQQQYPTAIEFELVVGPSKTLHLRSNQPGIIAGRVDPMILTLPAGASFTYCFDLTTYSDSAQKVWSVTLTPGSYVLSAMYTGHSVSQRETNLDVPGIALMPFWRGTVRSVPLHFKVSR